ncbi:MAG: hypothetical protein NXY59_07905 [Aigarchaeota archaeon]|nr:hypothetical protein [Candidatus Pelearchaeum maunauluense]
MRRRRAVSNIIGAVMLTALAVMLGFGVWAFTASMARTFMMSYSQDTQEKVANIRSSFVVEYGVKIDSQLILYLYNNGETRLVVVGYIFRDAGGKSLNSLSPSNLLTLEPKGDAGRLTLTIPSNEAKSVRIYAMPEQFFNPDDPFDKLGLSVVVEYEFA